MSVFPVTCNNVFGSVVPIPTLPLVDNVPVVILEAFKEVNEALEPTKLDADNVFDVLFHDKFGDCKKDVEPFPINI